MPWQAAVLLSLLLAAASASSAEPSIAACSCSGDECRCESTPGTGSESSRLTLEQTRQISDRWDQRVPEAATTTCSCSGTSCYCSQAAGHGDEAQPQHLSCLCTGSAGEACHCGRSHEAAQPPAVAAAGDGTAELMGRTREMSKAQSQNIGLVLGHCRTITHCLYCHHYPGCPICHHWHICPLR
mmetsp:Transcript_49550/g.130722  ORF Transcript_49550/g.130722 Transcript_49550/m.130722 type:complete len:184 (+) Transcript_49550:62-613(+)